jgi:hypothetical protein
MTTHGAIFDPETVALLERVLNEAWKTLSHSQQERLSKTVLAERILTAAGLGERDPLRLRARALIGIVHSAN